MNKKHIFKRPLSELEIELESQWLKENDIEIIPSIDFNTIHRCEPSTVLMKTETYRGLSGKTKIFIAQDETTFNYGG